VSDLLLAPRIRDVGPGDTLPGNGEFRKGNLLVTASGGLLLTPLRTKAYYLIETYADADTAALSLTITDSAGKKVLSTPPRTVQLGKGGGILSGALDLSGLPEGQYGFTTAIDIQGTRLERSAKFRMADLAETMARAADQRSAEQVTDAGYFSYMSQSELDQAAEPLALIAKSGEMSVYGKNLSLQARRRFLTEFWQRRDPTPGTPRNEAREQFYRAISYADKTYREQGRGAAPGWKTDRGRVFARNGIPDDVLRRSQQGNAPPYEVWRYSSAKGRYYIFADRTGFGAYSLIHSNDLQETGLTNWQRILGLDVVQDVSRFLGTDLVRLEPGS
jgi:GWxTD domain-containing protein